MKIKEKVALIYNALKKEYPNASCSLHFENDLQLLIATRLSAQCTDKRVNIITKLLFNRYKTINEFANCDIEELENIIKPCGFYHIKAKNIKEMCKTLIEKYNSEIPSSMDELLTLQGIGRKSANLILGEVFKRPAIVADTHCIRLSNRLGLCKSSNPLLVEKALRKIVPNEISLEFCHLLVFHGRTVCKAKKPICNICCVNESCDFHLNFIKKLAILL